MAFSLQEALEQIRSDKVKDRQQGLEAIDHIFADAENVRNLDPKHDGRAWLRTFQSLFACVLAEKTACIRKGSFVDAQPMALARLQRAAQTLRSLVDKSASLLTRKVVKALVIHIHQMLNHRGTLLQPIAPAYIAALCTLLRHPHHIDHLDTEDWSALASLCFDILLTRELGSDPATPADAQQWLASSSSTQPPPLQRRGLSLEHAVTAECLSHLISSGSAPLLGPHGYGLPLLADYVRFLLANPSESSAHLPTLTGLVDLLEHLELNHTSEVVLATLAVRHVLLGLWKTKNHLLKAQLLLLFRIVTDPIASCALARPDAASSHLHALPSDDATALLQAIHDTLLNDPDCRWALEPLHIDALLLRWPQTSQPVHRDTALGNAAFSLSPTSTDKDALAWCRIGLQVDLIDALITVAARPIDRSNRPATSDLTPRDLLDDHAAGPSIQATTSPAKRRRTTPSSSPQKRSRLTSRQPAGLSSETQVLTSLIDMLSHNDASAPSSPAARLSAVQLLTFLVLGKPHLLTHTAIDHLQKCLLALIADTDTVTVSWSLLAIASIMLMHSANANDPSRLSSATQAWVIAARKLQLPATSRAAAHLLSILLVTSALPESKLQPEISRFLADVDLQGPPIVCDSVCHLMALLLRHTTSSRAFNHLDPRAKIGAWFTSTYSPAATISSPAPHGSFVPYDDLIRLLDRIVAEGDPQPSSRASLHATSSIPGAAFAAAQRRARLQPLRDLVLRSSIGHVSLSDTTVQCEATAATPVLMSAEALHRMTVVLDRNVDACLNALQDLTADSNGGASLTSHAAITALHLAILSLGIGSRSTTQHRTSSIRSCCQIIVRVLATASSVDGVRSGTYALAIEQLTLLSPSVAFIPYTPTTTDLLVEPGPSSGIAAQSLAKEQPEQTRYEHNAIDESSRRIWKAIRDADMLDTMLASCAKLFETTLFGDNEAEAEPSSQVAVATGDIFDDVPESSSSTLLNATAAAHVDPSASVEVVIRSTVRLLLTVPRIVTGTADTRHQELVVSSFFDCSVQGIVALAPVLFDSFRDGTLWMSHRDVNDALDRIGTELLASYRYARHPAARLAAIRAVSCVMPLLLGELDEQSDLFDKVQKLSAFFADQIGRTKWPTPWEVQLACADFLAERLRLDPDGRLLRSGTARAPSASPVTALLKLHADPDVRVRALGSPIATSVVTAFAGTQADLDELYTIFRDGLPSDSTQPRLILTRALSLCNAAIASSSVRRSSIFYLLEIVLATGMLSSTVQELFAKLAARLGFPDASSCYQAFAGQITWGLATNGYDPLQLPWKVLGYASKRACLEATFAACGSMLLATQTADGRTQFDALVHLTRRNRQQGLQECLPFLTAAYIGFAAHAEQGTPSDSAAICERTLRDLASLGVVEGDDSATLNEMIVQADDLTISTLLLLFYQPGTTLADSRTSIFEALAPLDAKCAKMVEALTPTTDDGAASCHEPSRPFFSAAVLYTALAALPQLGITAFAPQTVYNVLRHMFYHISASRFVNDQVRMCAALRIYIAMCGDAFWKDALNNQLLIRSIERLLEQPQLHDEFRPLLVYACTASCLATKAPEPLVSCIVTWSQQLAERLIASPASGAWLLEAANALARSSPVATSAVVLLWPVDLANTEHTAVESLVDIGTLTYALEACPTLSPRLPSLLRIRTVLTRADKAQLVAFCKGPAWKLLERVASAARGRVVQIAGDPLGDVINDIFTAIVGVQEAACLHREARRLGGKWNPQAVEDFLEAADTSNIRTLSAAAILTVHRLAQDLPIEQGYEAYGALRDMAAVLNEPLAEVHPAKMPAAARQELGRVRPGLGPPLPAPRVADAQDVMDAELVGIASSADKWLCRMAAILCDLVVSMPHLALFRPARRLVEANAEAAHALFPILLLCFTADDEAQGSSAVATENRRRSGGSAAPSRAQRDQGLAATRAVVAQHFEAVLGCTTSDSACSEIIIQALLALRAFRPVQSEPDNVCFWYRVDPNLLASRCIAAGQLTAAIFFLEHGIQNATEKPQVAMLRSANQLLHQAYMNIDDPDAFYGITDGDVRDSVLMRLHHEGQWLRAFQYHAADYEACASDAERRRAATTLGQSLQHLGFPRLVDGIGLINAGEDRFASATDLGGPSASSSWDLPLTSQTLHDKAPSVEGILHTLRQASAEQDVDAPLSHAFRSKLQALCSTSVESAKALRNLQGDLLALGQIKDWRRASSSMGAEEAVAHLRSQWVRVEASERFELTERVLETRQSVLDAVRQRMHVDQIGDVLDGPVEDVARVERLLLVSSSRRAREHGKLQKAINAVARAQRIEDALGDGEELAQEEFAAVLWDQNEHSPAIQLLSQVVDGIGVTQSSSSSQKRRAARLLALLAQWRATARSQQPREIDRSLFEPALKLTAVPAAAGSNGESTPAAAEQSEIAYRWARFAEQHHRDSDLAEITRLRLYTDRRREEIAQNQRECERTSSKTERSKLLQYQRQAEKILLQDETRLTELEASRTHFLRRSVAMYARALATSDEHDDAVPRLVSLWMEHAADAELNRLLSTCLPSIPSHKFVGLMHQLSARLTELPDAADVMVPFQTNLSRLLLRMCQEHPFHCLYAIFALIKTGADAKAAATHRPNSRSTLSVPESGASQSASPPVLRSTAAEKIWTHIKRRSALGKRIRTFEELCLAYVEWAEFDLTSRADRYFQNSGSIKKGALRMPPSGELRLARMRDLDIPVATARLEIDATCRYETFVSIVRYGETFTTAGGIHLPKISECIGSDGRRYKQLFKRDDDLRQDAVMQQVFRMVNRLLDADRRTRERNLAIRTYTVLPLGPQCGLLEFVTNTLPLGEVLIELHARYRPQDITPAQARAKLRDAQTMRAEAKLEAFLDVCQAMQPAMRYFFSDAQRMPRDWYATRLRYTRSVSTNSIVGHVLGLGDRHVSNILLDQASGELVHIDFGVAFDQGKLLPIPELVPFRLTRDLVDGMGVHGVEGTFRRCCEETLRVLRAHGDAIKTVLEVFRHDPLFAWTSNPIKVLRAQEAAAAAEEESVAASMDRSGSTAPSGTAGTAPRARVSRSTTPMVALGDGVGAGVDTAELSADRAVSSVMSKLSSSLSVESTVNDLIQQAMDAGNLSAIFHGWQAAL